MVLITLYNYTECSQQLTFQSDQLSTDIIKMVPSLNYIVIDVPEGTNGYFQSEYDSSCNLGVNQYTFSTYVNNNNGTVNPLILCFYIPNDPGRYAKYPGGYINTVDSNGVSLISTGYSILYAANNEATSISTSGSVSDMKFPTSSEEGIYPIFSDNGNGTGNGTTEPPTEEDSSSYRWWILLVFIAIIIIIILVVGFIIYKKKKQSSY